MLYNIKTVRRAYGKSGFDPQSQQSYVIESCSDSTTAKHSATVTSKMTLKTDVPFHSMLKTFPYAWKILTQYKTYECKNLFLHDNIALLHQFTLYYVLRVGGVIIDFAHEQSSVIEDVS